MDELVKKLSDGQQPVEISLRPERTAAALKKRIDEYGLVHIRFTGTRGGTELGVTLDKAESDWSAADFVTPGGRVRLSGRLILNATPVKCVSEIDLTTLSGVGQLEIIP